MSIIFWLTCRKQVRKLLLKRNATIYPILTVFSLVIAIGHHWRFWWQTNHGDFMVGNKWITILLYILMEPYLLVGCLFLFFPMAHFYYRKEEARDHFYVPGWDWRFFTKTFTRCPWGVYFWTCWVLNKASIRTYVFCFIIEI